MIKKASLLIVLITFSIIGNSQTLNVSPYSRYALGDINANTSIYNSLGGANLGFAEYNFLNTGNPASYAFLKKERPVFTAGVNANFVNFTTSTNTASKNNVNLSHIAIGFPINEKIGMAFGLMPYTLVGYDISTKTELDNVGEINQAYTGKGGVNKAFLGVAYKIFDRDSLALSFGLNANFLFGSINNERFVEFPDDDLYYHIYTTSRKRISGFQFEPGLYYTQKLNDNLNLSIGAKYTLGASLNTKQDYFATTYANSFAQFNFRDTIDFFEDKKGEITFPSGFGFGASLKINNKWDVAAQYNQTQWNSFDEKYDGISNVNDTLLNTKQFSLGVRFTPKNQYLSTNNIFERTQYKFGIRTGNHYLQINNISLSDFGINFGLDIPVGVSSSSRDGYLSLSTLNLGVEYGTRGTTNNNLIKEQYTRLYFGISFMPTKLDRWFKKRKID